ncbi:MAG: FAD-binding oxidoreductase [Anaerolineales bacterium]
MKHKSSVVICGAGILGISAAYQLSVKQKMRDILIVDERSPLTLTSDKSTECYRNWWPGPGDAMVRLMNRSIDLMEEFAGLSNNQFALNRRGYLYVTCEPNGVEDLGAAAAEAHSLGAGQLRLHGAGSSTYQPHHDDGYSGAEGADLFTDPNLIRQVFPYLSPEVVGALHVRRAGWLSGQTYGAWLLEQAQQAGVGLLSGSISGIDTSDGSVSRVYLADGSEIETSIFINAAGPHLASIARMLDVDIPIVNEVHLKASFNDHLGAVDRGAPLVICADEQRLPWTQEERAMLAEDADDAWLLEALPSGAHTRPEGGKDSQNILVLWDIHNQPVDPTFPIDEDPMVGELAIRGLAGILPGMQGYLERMPRFTVDGGYYTKTHENRPLACPLPIEGAYVIGAASGYGIMAAAGLGELLAAHIAGSELPPYADLFDLARYGDHSYQQLLHNWGESWQL